MLSLLLLLVGDIRALFSRAVGGQCLCGLNSYGTLRIEESIRCCVEVPPLLSAIFSCIGPDADSDVRRLTGRRQPNVGGRTHR